MRISKFLLLLVIAVLFGTLMIQMRPMDAREKQHFFNHKSLAPDSLFQGENAMFASSGVCDNCHAKDPAGIASVDGFGQDINLIDDWSSSMMANSARDPFWRAKVSHEVFVNPQLQQEIETTCTSCHAPLGNYAAQSQGFDHYSIEQMINDSVALDGVSCLACHRQLPQPTIAQHTGKLFFEPTKKAFGPYTEPLVTPMFLATQYLPEYGAHIAQSAACAGCHSLIVGTVDLAGNPTGERFVEQATWHEWLNSSYPALNSTCQSCHIPRLEKVGVHLVGGNIPTPPRTPFGLHTLAGGNTVMLGLMRDNRDTLGIYASESQFNETITATLANLQQKSVQVQATEVGRTADSVFIDVKLTNITGHKLPSGYPARRMSVHFVLTDVDGTELFRSGGFDEQYAIPQENVPFEPHYNVIRHSDEIQIYEMVMGDVNGNKTTVLERGYSHLKDNRLVPKGFSVSNPQYDTTAIVLNMPDADFNYDPNEGSGSDVVHYRIGLNGYTQPLNVQVQAYYQSLPPSWLGEILTTPTPEVAFFQSMWNAADKSPVLMKTVNVSVPGYVGIDAPKAAANKIVWSTASNAGYVQIDQSATISVYALNGQLIEQFNANAGRTPLELNVAAGSYIIIAQSKRERVVQKIVVRE